MTSKTPIEDQIEKAQKLIAWWPDDVRGPLGLPKLGDKHPVEQLKRKLSATQERIAALEKGTERLRAALEDSSELLRRVKDENDEGGIADQIADNVAAMKEKP